jgi:hypothetical protein
MPEPDPGACFSCGGRESLRRDIEAWWQPREGWGYGPDHKLLTLCQPCLNSLQWFVELGGRPPAA